VILDASWPDADRRAAAARVARETESDLTAFVCRVDPSIADARAARRAELATDASDAGPAITAELRARFEPWPDAVVVDTSASPEVAAGAVIGRLGLGVSAG
jgi:predicted kinase